MDSPNRFGIRAVLFCLLASATSAAGAAEPQQPATVAAPQAQQTVERGLVFLREDAAKWRAEKTCSTCHHGTMTVFAFAEAKSQGYEVPAETMADILKWTKDRVLERIDQPRDTRPGWSMVNTPALYLSLMAQVVPSQEAVTADELKRIAAHLVRHQEADGSWAWSSAPPKNRPPPFFESDEVATLLGYVALGPIIPVDPNEKSEARDSRVKGAEWLSKSAPHDSTQAMLYRLLRRVREGESAEALKPAIDEVMSRQNSDGGWGQLKGAASDAYASGQAVYILNLAGLKRDQPEVQRAAAFLVSTQREDGSWPMTPRSHPDATPASNPVPIIYFGSAWGTLGLAKMFPKQDQ